MAIELASLVTRLKLDAKQYRAELASAEDQTKKMRLGMAALGAAAAASAIILASKSVKAAQEWAGEVRGLSRELGIGAKEASGLAFAAEHLGIPVETLQKSFGILSKNIVTNNKALAAAGIQTKTAQGQTRSFEAILGDLAQKFHDTPDGINKTALALQIFGRGGKALIPLLNQGREGLKRLEDEAKKFGLVITQDQIEKLRDLKFAQRDVQAGLKGFEVQLGIKLTPLMTFFAKAIGDVVIVLDHLPPGLVAGAVGAVALSGAFVVLRAVLGAVKSNFEQMFGALNAKTAATRADTVANEAETASLAESGAAATGFGAAIRGAGGRIVAFLGPLGLIVGGTIAMVEGISAGATALRHLFSPPPDPKKVLQALNEVANGTREINDLLKISPKFLADLQKGPPRDLAGGLGLHPLQSGLDSIDKALANLVKGGQIDKANLLFSRFLATLNLTPKTGAKVFDDYADALTKVGQSAEDAQTPLEGFKQSLSDQIELQTNLQTLLKRGASSDFVDALSKSGADALSISQQLVDGTKQNLTDTEGLWRKTLPAIAKEIHVFAGMTLNEFKQWKDGIAQSSDLVEANLDSLAGTAHLTARQILKAFQDQVRAERQAAANARIVFAALPKSLPVQEFQKKLAEMGPQQAAPILKALAGALTSGNKKVFNEIVRNIVESDKLSKIWSGEVAPAASKLSKQELKQLDNKLKDLGANSRIRAEVTALVKDDPHIPIGELDAILKDLGVRKNLRTKIEASVDASVHAHVTKIDVPASVRLHDAPTIPSRPTSTSTTISVALTRGSSIRNPLYVQNVSPTSLASGGAIGSGPSSGIPILAHPGEFVLRASAVKSLGLERLELLNRLGKRGLPSFQMGGLVSRMPRLSNAAVTHSTTNPTSITFSPVIHVHPAPGMDERELARHTNRILDDRLDEMSRKLLGRVRVGSVG